MFALEGQDDLLMIIRRVEALGKFLDTEDGKNLLAGTKRASNILAIEEKRDKRTFEGAPNPALYSLAEEKALADAADLVKVEASVAVMNEDFAAAMSAWPSCARQWMRSSTMSRSTTTIQKCARIA